MSDQNKLRDLRLNNGLDEGLELDVAIVGAGTAGLYAAWRLLTGGGAARRVHVFEMSDRIGGRLESVQLPESAVSGELGGMRYMTSQQIVTQLIENVFQADLTHVEFPMGEPANLLFYLRKQQFRANAWQQAQANGSKFQTRYYLDDKHLGYSPDQLFNRIIYDVLMADPWFVENYGDKVSQKSFYDYEFRLDSGDWDDIKPQLKYHFPGPYEGLNVNNIGFWNLVNDQASAEGYAFLDQAGGYYSNTINWNAAEAFPYMVGDFSSATAAYRTIEGGYDLLAHALAYHYLQAPDTELWTENRLVGIGLPKKGAHTYTLTFHNLQAKKDWTVRARQLILAMPRRSLELLALNNPLLQEDEFTYRRESVIMEPSFKLLLGFEKPWWQPLLNTTSGHSITDLPMRQCYYFGTDPANGHSLFLASYNDMQTVTFWKALNENRPDKPLFQPKATGLTSQKKVSSPQVTKHLAFQVMVDEAMRQVREMHQNPAIPDPYVALYKDWTDDPYGGGYHAWKADYDVKKTMQYMRKPWPEQQIYVCGEAYSDQQGWVEGAFCVAEKMLRDYFQLMPPSWLPAGYYLGW